MFEHAVLYDFSPTGGTRRTGEAFCRAIAASVTVVGLCAPEMPAQPEDADIAVLAAPVFGGRLPGIAARRLAALKGHGLPAVTLAVYGTRAFEDALLELNDIAAFRSLPRAPALPNILLCRSWAPAVPMPTTWRRSPPLQRECWTRPGVVTPRRLRCPATGLTSRAWLP